MVQTDDKGDGYPVDVLPEPLRSAAIGLAELNKVPVGMAAVSLLISLATAAQAEYDVRHASGKPIPVSIYVLVSALSGVRKSSTGFDAMAPNITADYDLVQRWNVVKREYEEADKNDKPRRPTTNRPLMVRMDATMETIPIRMVQGRPTFTQLLSEAATVTGKWSGGKQQLLATMQEYSNLWDGNPLVVDRTSDGGREVYTYGGRLSKLWFGQPGIMDPWLFSEAAANGYAARVIYYRYDGPRQRTPRHTPEERSRHRSQLVSLTNLIARARQRLDEGVEYEDREDLGRKIVSVNRDAENVLLDYDDACADVAEQQEPNDHCLSFLARAAEQARRVAGVFAVLRVYGTPGNLDAEVTAEDATAACQIVSHHYRILQEASDTATTSPATADRDELYRIVMKGLSNDSPKHVYHEDDGRTAMAVRSYAKTQAQRFKRDIDRLNKAIESLEHEAILVPVRGKPNRWHIMMEGAE